MAADEKSPSGPAQRPTGGEADDAWRPDWDPQRVTDADPPPAPDRLPGRRGPSPTGVVSGLLVLALVVVAAVLLLGKGDDRTPSDGGPSTGVAGPTPATSGVLRPDPAALASARAVFAQVNAQAGASPARQRSVLERVVDPAQHANQRGCAAAVTTVRLVPAWSAVRVAADGHLIIPSLVRVFTGTRITGTDVAIIDVAITAGQAGLPALCVS